MNELILKFMYISMLNNGTVQIDFPILLAGFLSNYGIAI